MSTSMKVLLFILLGFLSLCSYVFSLMIVGAAVSGSGCGKVCSDNMAMFQIASGVLAVLAVVILCIPSSSKKKNDETPE